MLRDPLASHVPAAASPHASHNLHLPPSPHASPLPPPCHGVQARLRRQPAARKPHCGAQVPPWRQPTAPEPCRDATPPWRASPTTPPTRRDPTLHPIAATAHFLCSIS